MNEVHWWQGFTEMTSVARSIGFYTGSVDHVSKDNVNKYVGSSWLHKREYLNIVFWSISKAFKSEDVSFKEALIRLFSESLLPLDDNYIKSRIQLLSATFPRSDLLFGQQKHVKNTVNMFLLTF